MGKAGLRENGMPPIVSLVAAIALFMFLHLIVAGGHGPQSAVCTGWGGGSFAVHGKYAA